MFCSFLTINFISLKYYNIFFLMHLASNTNDGPHDFLDKFTIIHVGLYYFLGVHDIYYGPKSYKIKLVGKLVVQ